MEARLVLCPAMSRITSSLRGGTVIALEDTTVLANEDSGTTTFVLKIINAYPYRSCFNHRHPTVSQRDTERLPQNKSVVGSGRRSLPVVGVTSTFA